MRLFPFLWAVAFFVLCSFSANGQVYSYIDENGVRVFTNIPPSSPVRDLHTSGSAPAVSAVDSRPSSGQPVRPKAASGGATATQKAKTGASKTSGALPAGTSPARADYDAIIEKHASEYRMDPALIRSMIATESGFNQNAVSPKGAQGLMQLMPYTAYRLGVSDPFDPEENILGGIKYMRYLLDTFAESPDSLKLSLAAYNAGENLVQRLGRIPEIRETHDYVRNIIQQYGKSQMAAPSSPAPVIPALFDFIDESGVRNVTNIPPIPRSGGYNPDGGTNSPIR
jgi:soluble lytic murein transglycosylase-like protein